MNLVPVKSSNIHSVGYDPTSQTLHVKFHSGKTFAYHDVLPQTHQALIGAASVGSFFGKNIRGNYQGLEVK